MSLPFLLGSAFTLDRSKATILGFVLYVSGGWLFAFIYFMFFNSVGIYTWWLGAAVGLIPRRLSPGLRHPLMPYLHPNMASEHHGVTVRRRLEPPGFLAMNYGYQTPLTTLLAQAIYGGVLGACVEIQQAMSPL